MTRKLLILPIITAKLCEGCVFVCIKGAHFDGHSAAEEAVNKGARAVVAEYDTGVENQILVKNTRDAYSLLCANFTVIRLRSFIL